MTKGENFTIWHLYRWGIDLGCIHVLSVLLRQITIEHATNYPRDLSDYLTHNKIPKLVRLQLLKSLSKD